MLVGTQVDLRDDGATIEKLAKNKQKPISIEQGKLFKGKYSHRKVAIEYLMSNYVNPNRCLFLGDLIGPRMKIWLVLSVFKSDKCSK